MSQPLRYEFIPAAESSRLDHIGTYKRRVPVSLERMYENALDWEHLPHLHQSSFTDIDCQASGGWGWRAQVSNHKGEQSVLELRLDESNRRWITRNLEGPNVGAEIWTHVFVVEPRQLDLVIDFFVPGVAREARDKVGLAYARAYETLYDEDVLMMTQRQAGIDRRLDAVVADKLVIDAPGPDQLPYEVELAGRSFLLNQHAGEWVVYPALCPHQLGPMTGQINAEGVIYCPWHGYGFDIATGACTTGARCQFGQRPTVSLLGDGMGAGQISLQMTD